MRIKSVLSLPFAAVLFDACARAQGPSATVRVDELIRLALENNRELAAVRQRLPEARGLRRQAGARPAPTVDISGTTGKPLRTTGEEQYSATYNFILETGGKRVRRVEVAETAITLAEAELDERARQVAYAITNLYADAIAQKQKVERLDRLISLNQESIRLTEARVREGDAAPLERQLLEVDLSRAEADRAATAGRFESIVLELKQAVGVDTSAAIVIAPEPVAPALIDVGSLRDRGLRDRPDVKLARLLEQQSAAETRLAQAQGQPDVTLSANYARQWARFDDQFGLTSAGGPVPLRDRDDVLTFGVQIPIGARKRNRGNVEAAAARAAAARMRREYLETRVPAEIAAALRRLEAARSALAIFDARILGQSEKNLGIIRQAYQLGQFRLLDVLIEQRRLIETQLSYIDAQTAVAKALADLEMAVGGRLR